MPTTPEKVLVIPCELSDLDVAHCVMLYDWSDTVHVDWVATYEGLLGNFNLKPGIALGEAGSATSYGKYSRIRQRIRGFLTDTGPYVLRLDSMETHPGDTFFSSDLRLVANVTNQKRKSAMIAVRVDALSGGIDRAVNELMQVLGPCYGGVLDLPAAMGPDYYLSSVLAVPRFLESEIRLGPYGERITRWRDRLLAGIRPSDGYFREIYERNFLTVKHLAMPFRGSRLETYMNAVGDLMLVPNVPGLYQWQLSGFDLERVRLDMEDSGLVLSSACEPWVSSGRNG